MRNIHLTRFEKTIISIGIAIIVFTISAYFISRFIYLENPSFVVQNEAWGTFGDYVGGVLGPLLSLVVILILVYDLKISRTELIKSVKAQNKSQKALNDQVEILTPKPNLTYYLYKKDVFIYAVIENLGDASAKEIFIKLTDLDGEVTYEEREFTYIPPKQKFELKLGRTSLSGETQVSSHIANISYRFNNKVKKLSFDYTQEMSEHLPDNNIASISGHLKDITSTLRNLSSSIS